MWISQRLWIQEREDAIRLRLERDVAVAHAKQQENTLAWFMHRLTQVEQERSKLIYNFTGVKVDAPTYEKEEIQSGVSNPLNALPTWNDVGDKVAAELGIDWNKEGEVIYGVTK
jgi:hypothetical protein